MTDPRPPRTLVYIVDGTLSSLEPGRETHAGRLFHLLEEGGHRASLALGYHPGVQGEGWRRWLRAAVGLGLNDAILEGYARLASWHHPGDRIFLFGYSRGAYAVRSLAGLIGRVGLLRPEAAIHRRRGAGLPPLRIRAPEAIAAFRAAHCLPQTPRIEMIGVWDTVKALGIPWPILSFIHPMATEFHDHDLGPHVRHGFHALALDEDRVAFRPELWDPSGDWPGHVRQLWFPGAHGDVGGDLGGFDAALPLAHAPLLWMLEQAEAVGLALPPGWRDRFPADPTAPMLGPRRGIGRMFVIRTPREVRTREGEDLHPSVARRMEALPYHPRARGLAP